uniref:Chromosome 9 open reading frame 135 n=1 Tax=Chelydra serpentina TaxID=8475 RepID=A0A8C3S892_CHESE
MDMGPPDVLERKGALTLRSHCVQYGRPTLMYRWHQNREAEPKDYDINEVPLGSKNLCQSTYSRFGTVDGVNIFSLETGLPKTGIGAVLPRHPSDHFQMLVILPQNQQIMMSQPDGYSIVHRKCHSQFTDTDDYRRHGINTWQDESGIYANADIKQKVFPVTNPIPSNVHEDHL